MHALLQAVNLRKSYSSVVLRDFSFDLARGEVHALVGSNGAGKSTFARILCGLVTADSGEMFIAGRPHRPASRQAAAEAGVVMVMQELNVIPTLSVAENLFLDRLPSLAGFIRYRKLRAGAEEALNRVGLHRIDVFDRAGALGVGQQQMIEIASALARRCSVMILDEPTAALSNREVDHLFENIRRLRDDGVGIIYISHRMDEIRAIADRVTVLRDGARVATHAAAEVAPAQLVREMAGHDLAQRPETSMASEGAVALRVVNVQMRDLAPGISLEVRAGEILGIAGLAGSGRSELLRAIYDSGSRKSGRIEVSGAQVSGGPESSIAAGLGLIPEDRKTEGLLLPLAVRTNITLSTLKRHSGFAGWLRRDKEIATTRRLTKDLDIRCASTEQPVVLLSGGNQQKVLLGRWLARDCSVLLLDEPTRGVDAAAKDQIHALLRTLATQGKALLVVSSELEELMSLSHRILVLSDFRYAGEFLPQTWSREAITEAAFSGYTTGGKRGDESQ
jgi:ribose transport system ATP-binding protein